MNKYKNTDLKEKILREILINYHNNNQLDLEINNPSHFTRAVKIGIEDGYDAGRREVLEDCIDSLNSLTYFYCHCEYIDAECNICQTINRLKDLISDPQTPQTKPDRVKSDNSRRETHESVSNTSVRRDKTEESSSESCGFEFICFDKGRMGRRTKCGKDGYFCDGCKQKQEKKEVQDGE